MLVMRIEASMQDFVFKFSFKNLCYLFVFLGHHVQRIFYEGMNQIYFPCEKIGHKNTPCPNFKHNLSSNQNPLTPEVHSESKTLHQEQIS